jgi:hypothetical protein
VSVRIVGPCQSACTVLLGHIPRSRICVTGAPSLGFHLAHLPAATLTLWAAYQGDIRAIRVTSAPGSMRMAGSPMNSSGCARLTRSAISRSARFRPASRRGGSIPIGRGRSASAIWCSRCPN